MSDLYTFAMLAAATAAGHLLVIGAIATLGTILSPSDSRKSSTLTIHSADCIKQAASGDTDAHPRGCQSDTTSMCIHVQRLETRVEDLEAKVQELEKKEEGEEGEYHKDEAKDH